MASRGQRLRAWEALAKWVDPEQLASLYAVHPMTDLPQLAEQIVAGGVRGRVECRNKKQRPGPSKAVVEAPPGPGHPTSWPGLVRPSSTPSLIPYLYPAS